MNLQDGFMAQPHLIGAADACDRLDIDRATLSRWVEAGKITPALTGRGRTGARFFDSTDVDRLHAELLAQAEAKLARLRGDTEAAA
jgi:predicted site-specific integrase-resolvase